MDEATPKIQKSLQVLTALGFLLFNGCGAVRVRPVEEGDSLRYHARVGYFLHPPRREQSKYIDDLDRYSPESDFKRCEPSSIVRLHERFEKRYVEIDQKGKKFLFDTVNGEPIKLINGKYTVIDKYFKKDFPLPNGMVKRLGQPSKKSDLICQGKVWNGMTQIEFLITKYPPDNIKLKIEGDNKIENWQYETENYMLKEYIFVNGILQTHSDL